MEFEPIEILEIREINEKEFAILEEQFALITQGNGKLTTIQKIKFWAKRKIVKFKNTLNSLSCTQVFYIGLALIMFTAIIGFLFLLFLCSNVAGQQIIF